MTRSFRIRNGPGLPSALDPGTVKIRMDGSESDLAVVASVLAKTGIEVVERTEPYGRADRGHHLSMTVRLGSE
jgi:hypothetical protein